MGTRLCNNLASEAILPTYIYIYIYIYTYSRIYNAHDFSYSYNYVYNVLKILSKGYRNSIKEKTR